MEKRKKAVKPKSNTKRAQKPKTATASKNRSFLDKFKIEAAKEVGINLKDGYNGNLTARQAGSIGGRMVKKMIESYKKRNS